MTAFVDHDLSPSHPFDDKVRYELRPCYAPNGSVAEGLHTAWITLDNPGQLNSYTTQMVKDVIFAFRRASNARDVVAVVFTGAGDRAFCTGGNTKEYAEYYAGRPEEYAQYMRLFNDMVSAILMCDKPTICRVNGMRIGGGQEIGMACDSTDFLPLFVGIEQALISCALCEPWSAHKAMRLGLITDAVPVLRVDGELTPNPLVETDAWTQGGRIVYGEPKTGQALADAKALFKRGEVDLGPLDERVAELVTTLLMTFPGCTRKTIESLRKHKLEHWDRNKESSRSWLALNMMNEANAGFRAFNEGPRGDREIDFIALRQRLARGEKWGPELIDAVLPKQPKA